MKGDCERMQDLLIELAGGTIDPADRAVLQEHLAACSDCSEEFASLERTFGALRSDGYVEPSPFYWTRFDAALRRKLRGGRERAGAPDWQRIAPRLTPAAVALCCFAVGLWMGLKPSPRAAGVPPDAAVVASYDVAREAPVISPESKFLVESGLDGHPVYAADTLRPNALAPFGEPSEMVLASSPRLAVIESGLGQRSLGR